MDRPSGQREMVFCHECKDEWYRNEHGLSCPNCHSDFCEVIEADHDPRADYVEDEDDEPPPVHYHTHPNFGGVPDPDEDDIDHVRFMPNPNGDGFSMHGVSATGRQNPVAHTHIEQPGGTPNDPREQVFRSFTTMVNGMMGGVGPQPQQTHQTHTRTMTFGFNNGRVFYSSNTGGGPREGLQPRDPNSPQPDPPFQDLNTIFGQMFGDLHAQRAPGPGPSPPGGPFASLFNMFFNPANAAHGDAVYTQEALDRVISQLMEQNQAGNAPGPADPNEIASLPKKRVDKTMLGDQGNTDCSICMDSVELGQEVTVLYCGHWFHDECIGMWLNSHDTCPHCRMGIREAKEKKSGASPTSAAGSSGAEQAEPSSRRSQSRRTSSMSLGRRRSSANSSGQGGGNAGGLSGGSGGGIFDRARNLFSRSSPNS